MCSRLWRDRCAPPPPRLLPGGRAELQMRGSSPRGAGVPLNICPRGHKAAWKPRLPRARTPNAVMTLEESVSLDRWVHRGPGINETAEQLVPCSCPWDLCPRVTLSPAEHPCAAPFAFTLAIPSGISLKHKGSMFPERRPEPSEVVTAPLPQRHLPAEAPESRAQRLDGEGKGNMLCHLSESHPNLQP